MPQSERPSDIAAGGGKRESKTDESSPKEQCRMWYAAHVILCYRWKSGPQDRFPVYENVYLVEAETSHEAHSKAEQLGRRDEGDDRGTLRWDGHSVTRVFAGVRRIISVAHEAEAPRLGDGDEVTFLPFVVDSEAVVRDLASGRPVRVLYYEEPGPPAEGGMRSDAE